MPLTLDARIDGGDWSWLGDPAPAVAAALDVAGCGGRDVEVSLLLTTDAAIAALNETFRGQAKPTNVLSWPAFSLSPPSPGAAPALPPDDGRGPLPLGDIALAEETVLAEARQRNLAFADHATHLVVHGVLHLLGFDHDTDADAAVMEGLEREALAVLGVADPYM
jgi:probable rRNA maturation factor